MQERKTPEPNRPVADSEATSDKTLADIEQEEQVTGQETENSEGSEIRSPDGALDGPDESKNAGPM
ncbi:MAG TPA: hypothetical protein VGO56_08470 [Pyrinomonadaceae bacterium]|jgi:hypothetical protein|nr:hypothetical protein [Pyrinomonadaceae bacterium]